MKIAVVYNGPDSEVLRQIGPISCEVYPPANIQRIVGALRENDHEVVTIEGLGDFQHLHPLQAVFEQLSSFQCGFCAPGMIISTKALLDKNPHPTEPEVREALSGNLCRCTGYTKIIDAIMEISRGPEALESRA